MTKFTENLDAELPIAENGVVFTKPVDIFLRPGT